MTFTELLDRYGIDYRSSGHEHCRPGWVQLDCPHCSPGWGHFRLGYNIYGGYMNCWSCGPKRTANVLMELTGHSYRALAAELKDLVKTVAPPDYQVRGQLRLPPYQQWPLKISAPHWTYLVKRGYDPDEIEEIWGVKALRVAAELSWRVFIPIHYRSEIVSWTTRSIIDKHALRYRSAKLTDEKIHHKDLLYGEDFVRHSIIVCEGPLDVWRIGPGAVCTFGTGFKRSQIARISRYPIRVVCFDNEASGVRQAQKLAAQLAPFDGETYQVTLDAKDPGSASNSEIQELRRRFL